MSRLLNFRESHGSIYSSALVELIDLVEILSDGELEFSPDCFGKVQSDIPVELDTLRVRLFDATEIIVILEQQDAPVLNGVEVNEGKQVVLLDRLNHEVDMGLSLLEGGLLRLEEQFVEGAVDNVAAQLFELE